MNSLQNDIEVILDFQEASQFLGAIVTYDFREITMSKVALKQLTLSTVPGTGFLINSLCGCYQFGHKQA